MASSLFDNTVELPNNAVKARTDTLVGFDTRYQRVAGNLKLLLNPDGLKAWSKKFHKQELPVIKLLADRYPLIILAGDAGTGKTVMAESIADKMTRELDREGYFLKLSTRVRGEGMHGQMSILVNDAFEHIKREAGKRKLAFLLIDEADAVATTRSTIQMHQEEKAAVNTLIQKIDEIRELGGRAIVFMATNRLHFIDEAIIRRAAAIMEFERPNEEERKQLFAYALEGIALTKNELQLLADATGPEANEGLGYSFSDIRLKLLPEAISSCFPDKALTVDLLLQITQLVKPSPQIK